MKQDNLYKNYQINLENLEQRKFFANRMNKIAEVQKNSSSRSLKYSFLFNINQESSTFQNVEKQFNVKAYKEEIKPYCRPLI